MWKNKQAFPKVNLGPELPAIPRSFSNLVWLVNNELKKLHDEVVALGEAVDALETEKSALEARVVALETEVATISGGLIAAETLAIGSE
jgi:predicted  nucleic acid-binding Zn-ribbon protein